MKSFTYKGRKVEFVRVTGEETFRILIDGTYLRGTWGFRFEKEAAAVAREVIDHDLR